MNDHHIPERHLIAYAAGEVPEAFSVLIAAHLDLCEACLIQLRSLEAAGGQILREAAPKTLEGSDLLERTLARLDATPIETPTVPTFRRGDVLPPSLQAYVASVDAAPWKKISAGSERCRLVGREAGKTPFALLYRLQPGQGIIEHDHSGDELMLVLSGGLDDGQTHFRRGDVIDSTPGDVHRMIVDSEDPCLCIIANASPIRPTSLMGRLIARWLRL